MDPWLTDSPTKNLTLTECYRFKYYYLDFTEELTLSIAYFRWCDCLSCILLFKSAGLECWIILFLITEGFGIGIMIISRRSLLWNLLDLAKSRATSSNIVGLAFDSKYMIKLLLSMVAMANAQQSEVSCWSWISFDTFELRILLRKCWRPTDVSSLNVLYENRLKYMKWDVRY